MSFTLDIDPLAAEQIAALPLPALAALVEAFAVLEVVPWNGLPLNQDNPDAAVRQLPFGTVGMIAYLILDDHPACRRPDRHLGGMSGQDRRRVTDRATNHR